jgi:hypothetical protein
MMLSTRTALRRVFGLAVLSCFALGAAGLSAPVAVQAKAKDSKATKRAAEEDTPRAAAAASGGAQPTLLGQFGGWGAYRAAAGGRKLCFALAKPTASKTKPAGRTRDPAYMFVATRPNEKVRDEVSVHIGYPFKGGSDANLEVGGTRFALYTQGDGAWIKNAADEARMVEAMRRAGDVTMRGTSAKGAETTDVFSMKGLAQALDRVAQECR